jgi:hypothetical protein
MNRRASADPERLYHLQETLPSIIPRIPQPQRLQLPVQRRAFHPDKRRRPRDIPGKALDLDLEIFPLEILARFAQRGAHDGAGETDIVPSP